ncbi:hypothetical protein AIT14_006480 [Salmonella enterica subsp. arizonae serovar 41:z4,z23:- str. 01-0089]|nr:hypothetical protein [Salmonella enterica]EGE4650739.1 hypothetical protein [Salmonella enterica subsp. arizonae serovar 41:z4,z23:- str. 01-0089]QVP42621.1 hypothetical protein AIT14_006480 [Salmonella enterica subsp. arizonae serovar 41:z4,z23:- str. 01-0089]
MQQVKIYTASPSDLSPPVQSESFCVDLVLASDYRELEAKCAALSAKLSMINDLMKAAEQANKLAQEATETLVQERNALSAENAELNKFITQSCYVFDGEQHEISDAYICATDGLMPETPATDAFLAEVRAHGVEMFSEKFGGGTLISDMVKEIAKDFAAQLRKGVQS